MQCGDPAVILAGAAGVLHDPGARIHSTSRRRL